MDARIEQRLRKINAMSMGYFSSPMFPYKLVFGEYNALVDELLDSGMSEPLPPDLRLDPTFLDEFISPRYKEFEVAWRAAHPEAANEKSAGSP